MFDLSRLEAWPILKCACQPENKPFRFLLEYFSKQTLKGNSFNKNDVNKDVQALKFVNDLIIGIFRADLKNRDRPPGRDESIEVFVAQYICISVRICTDKTCAKSACTISL